MAHALRAPLPAAPVIDEHAESFIIRDAKRPSAVSPASRSAR
jgi:hypothetical protein